MGSNTQEESQDPMGLRIASGSFLRYEYSMITLQDIGRSFGDHILFEGVSMQLTPGKRYGVVGANGSGKTTFLKILMGEDEPNTGRVSISKRARVGYLVQDRFESLSQEISAVVMMGNETLWAAMCEKEELLDQKHSMIDPNRLAALEEQIANHGGYAMEAEAGQVLEGLGIPSSLHQDPLRTLSGGFQLRVLLAQALVSNPDVLLLDEPTNHLDIFSIHWLEKFMRRFPGVVIVVSHDQRFLENTSTHILDIDYQTISLYHGSYSRFVALKGAERSRREAEIAKREKEKANHEAFVERFRSKASKARQAQSKLKQIQKIQIEELPESSRRSPIFSFTQMRPSGKDVLEVSGVSKGFSGKSVLSMVDFRVQRQDRLAIIGPNGIGKSTLLKLAIEELKSDSGDLTWGHEVKIGYFPQDHSEIRNTEGDVLSWTWNIAPTQSESFIRGQLGQLLFTKDDVKKKLSLLSGGESARVIFCGMQLARPNVLVLDEPTNHLDIEAVESLIKALHAFEGTVIFVSHNRHFVSRVADRIIDIKVNDIDDFQGTYDEYLNHCGEDYLDVSHMPRQEALKKKQRSPERTTAAADHWQQKKESVRQKKRIEKQIGKTTETIETLEKQLQDIETRFCEPAFYEMTKREEIRLLEKTRSELSTKLESTMQEWEALEAELEEVECQNDSI